MGSECHDSDALGLFHVVVIHRPAKSKMLQLIYGGKDQAKIVGTVTVRAHPAGTIDRYYALKNAGRIEEAQALINAGKVKVRQKNMIVWSLNYGFDVLVQFLISAYTGSFAFASTLGIAWGEIGTGNTTPTNTDTALTTPTNRTTISYAADLGFNEAQTQFFFLTARSRTGRITSSEHSSAALQASAPAICSITLFSQPHTRNLRASTLRLKWTSNSRTHEVQRSSRRADGIFGAV